VYSLAVRFPSLRTLALAGAAILIAVPAFAQATLGVRGGVAADPTQGLIGAHLEEPALAPHDDLTFRQGVEAGFGGGSTVVSGFVEVAYWVKLSDAWRSYLGAGPAMVFQHLSACTCGTPSSNGIHGVFNGFVGFQNEAGMFLEVEGSGGSNASLHLTVGFLLRKKSK